MIIFKQNFKSHANLPAGRRGRGDAKISLFWIPNERFVPTGLHMVLFVLLPTFRPCGTSNDLNRSFFCQYFVPTGLQLVLFVRSSIGFIRSFFYQYFVPTGLQLVLFVCSSTNISSLRDFIGFDYLFCHNVVPTGFQKSVGSWQYAVSSLA